MIMINLRPRLAAIAEMLPTCTTVADIGADHGRLALALLQRNKTKQVIISDISEASLAKAQLLAARCKAGNKVIAALADGLQHLRPAQTDALVLAGMGGELIARILDNSPTVAQTAKCILMQPMRGESELREYLRTHLYEITDEQLVLDARRYYVIIAAVYRGKSINLPAHYSDAYGARLYENNDPLLLPLLQKAYSGKVKRMQGAQNNGQTPLQLQKKIEEIEQLLKLLEEKQT